MVAAPRGPRCVGRRPEDAKATGESHDLLNEHLQQPDDCNKAANCQTADLQIHEAVQRRRLTVGVPDGILPGETRLSLSLDDGHRLLVTVPPEAVPGEKLVLTEDDSSGWTCAIVSKHGPGCAGAPQPKVGEPISFLVPPGVTPGSTKMAVDSGEGDTVMVLVPEGAVPGDKVVLAKAPQEPGEASSWRCSLVRERVELKEADTPRLQLLARLPPPEASPPDSLKACQQLFNAARSAGCHVSDKLERGRAAPLNIPGVLAADAVTKGEELMRIPVHFHITPALVEKHDPDLWRACMELKDVPRGRRSEMAQSAYVALLLQEAEGRAAVSAGIAAQAGDEMHPEFAGIDEDVMSVWRSYADGILNEFFDRHPYRLGASDPDGVRATFRPSPEADFFVEMAHDLVNMHQFLQVGLSSALPHRRCPDLRLYAWARLSLLTRVFQTCDRSTLVPAVDLFNHSSTSPGVSWRWDPQLRAMVVTADRDHAAGEELLCSYGPRSNALLYRTYGFTHPPEQEPGWSCVVRPSYMRPVYEAFMPYHSRPQIMLDTVRLEDCLCKAMNSVAACKRDAGEFLRFVCARLRWHYEGSVKLMPALQALARARALDPTSSAWWAELQGADRTLADQEWARLQMCEYLCLVAHQEAVDCADGKLLESRCLAGAENLRSLLGQALRLLREGKRFGVSHSSPASEEMGAEDGEDACDPEA